MCQECFKTGSKQDEIPVLRIFILFKSRGVRHESKTADSRKGHKE